MPELPDVPLPDVVLPDLALAAWRAASQARGIEEALERVAPRLSAQFGAQAGYVQLLDLERQRVVTVASFGARDASARPARAELTPEATERILTWCRRRDAVSQRAAIPVEIVPPSIESDASAGFLLAGPLCTGDDPLGALVVRAGPKPGPELAAAVRVLLEPLAAAVEHDRRIQELSRLREAAEAENRALRTRLQRHDLSATVIGAERGLRDVLERVTKVAVTDAPVLIFGETGSGKEVIARAIHERSARAAGPIVRVNCGAIASELVDSELFGHEKGSFTGATGTHRGWFERADGGTLFLDEIAELPLSVQVRLLRVLQDGTFQRVGGQRSLSCDVRLVAATHRDLERMVVEGKFRQDLWYRIGVFPIRLPSLRERPQDIPDLAAHFATAAGKRLGSGALSVAREDVELLLAYDWPGNVRELAAVVERAAILGDGRRLDLRAALGVASSATTPTQPLSAEPPAPAGTPVKSGVHFATLAYNQRVHVERALDATRGRIEGPHGAAALLGINPHTLRSRMRKLGIDWRDYRAPRV